MSSWFAPAWETAQQDETDDERRAREQNTGDVPYAQGPSVPQAPSPAAGFLGQQMAQPAPPPQYGDPFVDAPTGSPRAQLEASRQGESQYANAGLALATALPIIASGPVAGPLGVIGSEAGNWLDQQVGAPELPIVGGPFGLLGGAIGGGTDPGAIGRVGERALGSAPALAARDAFSGAVRGAMPEPSLFPGMSAGIPPIHPSGGEMAFGPGSRGGGLPVPSSSGSLEDQLRASLEARGVSVPPELKGPAFPSSYPSIPEGTMGTEFPDVRFNPQDAANGGVRQLSIDPNSPAARMGAPLAYDPQFMTPPPADAAMRELGVAPTPPAAPVPFGDLQHGEQFRIEGSIRPNSSPDTIFEKVGAPGESAEYRDVNGNFPGRTYYMGDPNNPVASLDRASPVDNMARPDMAQEMSRRLEGGGLPAEASSSVSPPPPSRSLDDIASELQSRYFSPGGTLPERTLTQAGEGSGFTMRPLTDEERRAGYVMYGPNDVAPGNLQPGQQVEGAFSGSSRTLDDVTRDLQGGYSAPAGVLPERTATRATAGEGFNLQGEPFNTPTASQRIDQLIADAQTPSLPTMPLSNEEAIREGARLGVPVDAGALHSGTPLARQQEMDLVSAARDLENSLNSSTEGRALDAFVSANKGGADAIPNTGGGARGGSGGTAGGMGGGSSGAVPPAGAAGQGNLLSRAYHNLNDLAFGQFGGDISALRQTAGRSVNVLYLPDTIRSVKATAASIRDAATGIRLNDGLKEALEAKGITPKMADWRSGADFVNRETGTSSLLNRIPGYEALNRGFATAINFQRYGPIMQMIDKNANLTKAELQHIADYSAIETGRGTFGKYDKQIANVLGPVMTSARMAASWPERMAYLIPLQKVGEDWKLFGPTWQMAVKSNGGMAVTGLGVMALSSQLGAKVNYQSGDIAFGDKHYNIWGGGYGFVKAAHDVYTGTKNGKDYPRFLEQDAKGAWKGSLAEFFRNKTGPLPEDTLAAIKETGLDKKLGVQNITNFLRPEFWDDGATGKSQGVLDRASQFATFLWMQDTAKFIWGGAEGGKPDLSLDTAKNALTGAVPSVLGISTNYYHENTPNPLTQMRDAALGSAKYSDLFPKEQQALNEALQKKDPEGYAKALTDSQSRQDPAIRSNQEARDAVKSDRNNQIAPIVGGVVNGTYTPGAAYAAIKEIQTAAAQKNAELLKDPAYLKATSDFTNDSVARRALDTYFAIPNTVKGPDGKVDWVKADQLQAELIASIAKTDPSLARRLLRETETTNLYEDLKKLAPKVGAR